MKKIIKKILKRYSEIKTHPIAGKMPLSAMTRYIYFNLILSRKSEVCIDWLEGLKLFIRKGDAGLIGNYYFKLADFHDSIFIVHFLRESDTFVDIGANLGHFSILASGLTNSDSVAFEPVPSSFYQLKRNVNLNGLNDKIKLHNIGISDKEGTLYFSNDKNNMNRVVDSEYVSSIQIKVNSLDSILKIDKISILKIDVEGFEKFVLNGASQTLDSSLVKGLIVELNGSGKKYGVDEIQIHNFLLEKGFLPFEYNGFERSLFQLETYNSNSFNTIYLRDLDFVKDRLRNGRRLVISNQVL